MLAAWALAMSLGLASLPLPAQTVSGTYELVNAGSGMVLEVPGLATNAGTSVDQWIANGGTHQQWTIASAGGGTYQILNGNSGQALEVLNQSTNSGAIIDQWNWWGGNNQKWTLSTLANGRCKIANVNSGLALEIAGASVTDGAAIDQSAWNGGAFQQWLLLPVGAKGTLTTPSGGSGAAAATFHGFNWADPADNFIDGPLLLSGLSLTNHYAAVQAEAALVLSTFSGVGANAVRLPINPETVLGAWWSAYRGTIDEAATLGFKVIVCPWTGNSQRTGKVNDLTCFWSMWDVVVAAYNGNGNVYFEILNEPYGYTTTDWLNLIAAWRQRYPTVAPGRILVGGTGSDDNVINVATATNTTGCLYSVHDYGFWDASITNSSGWFANLANRVGSYAKSTVLTEFGTWMTRNWNFAGGSQGNNEIASMIGFADYCRSNQVGALYWPGFGSSGGDTYSLFSGNSNNSVLTLNSPSGLDLLKYAWSGYHGAGTYQIINGASGLALEVAQAATTNGASVSQWNWNGGASQQWTVSSLGNGYYKIINQNSGRALEVAGGSTAWYAPIDQGTWTGSTSQQWAIRDLTNSFYQILNCKSGLALEVGGYATNNGAFVDQWPGNGGANQAWTFGPPANPPVAFSLQPVSPTQIKVQWSQGLLLQATNPAGPWNSLSPSPPLILAPSAPQLYFRQLVY